MLQLTEGYFFFYFIYAISEWYQIIIGGGDKPKAVVVQRYNLVGGSELWQLFIEQSVRQNGLLIVVVIIPLLPIGKDDFTAQFQ